LNINYIDSYDKIGLILEVISSNDSSKGDIKSLVVELVDLNIKKKSNDKSLECMIMEAINTINRLNFKSYSDYIDVTFVDKTDFKKYKFNKFVQSISKYENESYFECLDENQYIKIIKEVDIDNYYVI